MIMEMVAFVILACMSCGGFINFFVNHSNDSWKDIVVSLVFTFCAVVMWMHI